MKPHLRKVPLIAVLAAGLVVITLVGAIASYPGWHQRWLDACLWRAATRNASWRVSELVKQGANINERDTDGNPLLTEVLGWGFTDTARVLLHSKPDVNAVNSAAGVTSLMLAAGVGEDDIVTDLMS